VLACFGMCWRVCACVGCVGMCWRVLACADVWLVCVGVCWRLLMYGWYVLVCVVGMYLRVVVCVVMQCCVLV